MNPAAEEFNPDTSIIDNRFEPHTYDQVTSLMNRLSPEEIDELGWDCPDDLWDAINTEFMITEAPGGTQRQFENR